MPPFTRVRTLPWLVLLDVARTTMLHVNEHLDDKDRRQVAGIARRTKGDVRKLTEREKADLKRIARDLNVTLLARNLVPSATRLRRRR